MTREEAITIIGNLEDKDILFNPCDVQDAKTMAIKALEQEPTDDYFRRMAEVVISQLRNDRDRLEDELAKLEQEPSGDLISRQAVLDAFGLSEKTRKYGGDHSGYDTVMKYEIQDVVEDLPSAEQEPKTGHWVHKGQGIYCSECGKESGYNPFGASRFSDYCLNCGVKMVKPDEGYANDWIGYSR